MEHGWSASEEPVLIRHVESQASQDENDSALRMAQRETQSEVQRKILQIPRQNLDGRPYRYRQWCRNLLSYTEFNVFQLYLTGGVKIDTGSVKIQSRALLQRFLLSSLKIV